MLVHASDYRRVTTFITEYLIISHYGSIFSDKGKRLKVGKRVKFALIKGFVELRKMLLISVHVSAT